MLNVYSALSLSLLFVDDNEVDDHCIRSIVFAYKGEL